MYQGWSSKSFISQAAVRPDSQDPVAGYAYTAYRGTGSPNDITTGSVVDWMEEVFATLVNTHFVSRLYCCALSLTEAAYMHKGIQRGYLSDRSYIYQQ